VRLQEEGVTALNASVVPIVSTQSDTCAHLPRWTRGRSTVRQRRSVNTLIWARSIASFENRISAASSKPGTSSPVATRGEAA
jgi:hypothetical protein